MNGKMTRRAFVAAAAASGFAAIPAFAAEDGATFGDIKVAFPEGWEVKERSGSLTISAPDGTAYTVTVSRPAEVVESQGYGPGNLIVGQDIPAGEYVVVAESDRLSAYVCAWEDVARSHIAINDNTPTQTIIEVSDGQLLELDRAKAYPFDEFPHELLNARGEGTWKVGVDLEPGTYVATQTGDMSAYWCIWDKMAPGRRIAKNGNFEGSDYIVVEEGDYLELDRCSVELA